MHCCITGLSWLVCFSRAGFADRVKSRLRQWDPWGALDERCGSDIHPCVGETSLRALQSCLGLWLALLGLIATPNSPVGRCNMPKPPPDPGADMKDRGWIPCSILNCSNSWAELHRRSKRTQNRKQLSMWSSYLSGRCLILAINLVIISLVFLRSFYNKSIAVTQGSLHTTTLWKCSTRTIEISRQQEHSDIR